MLDLLRDFGLNDFYLELSTRPPGKAVGLGRGVGGGHRGAAHDRARAMGLELVMDEGGGAFYGPKISVQARDAIGRTWQMSTIQLDFQLPQRFGLEYVGADNARHRPIMIHRALFGSVERFMAVLLEHYAGALPTWLCPEQVRVLPVTDDHDDYAQSVVDGLRGGGPAGHGRRQRREAGRADPPGQAGQDPLRAGGRATTTSPAGTVGVNRRGWTTKPEQGVALADLVAEVADEVDAQGPARGPGAGPSAGVTRGRAVSLEHLWAGWRREYIVEATARERAGGPPTTRPTACSAGWRQRTALGGQLVVWRGETDLRRA